MVFSVLQHVTEVFLLHKRFFPNHRQANAQKISIRMDRYESFNLDRPS